MFLAVLSNFFVVRVLASLERKRCHFDTEGIFICSNFGSPQLPAVGLLLSDVLPRDPHINGLLAVAKIADHAVVHISLLYLMGNCGTVCCSSTAHIVGYDGHRDSEQLSTESEVSKNITSPSRLVVDNFSTSVLEGGQNWPFAVAPLNGLIDTLSG